MKFCIAVITATTIQAIKKLISKGTYSQAEQTRYRGLQFLASEMTHYLIFNATIQGYDIDLVLATNSLEYNVQLRVLQWVEFDIPAQC